VSYRRRTDGLVRDDLDALNVASRLEDLTQHIFRDAWVQSSHVQRALVRLGGCTTGHVARAAAGGRHGGHGPAGQGRAHGGRDRVGVLGDDWGERRGHLLLLWSALIHSIVPRGARVGRRRRHISPRVPSVGHLGG
jgi:hypothetical protein